MDRRDFIKFSGGCMLCVSLGGMSGADLSVTNLSAEEPQENIDYYTNKEVFERVFDQDLVREDEVVEYPLTLLAPQEKKENIAYSIYKPSNIPVRHVESDFIQVPTMPYTTEEERANVSLNVIVAAALDRNMLVYNDDAPVNCLTKRLVAMMKVAMRRNGYVHEHHSSILTSSMDTLLVDKSITKIDDKTIEKTTEVFGVDIVRMDMSHMKELFKDLYGTTPNNRQMVIGLDTSKSDFVSPFRVNPKEYGAAVLDNKSVLIGAA